MPERESSTLSAHRALIVAEAAAMTRLTEILQAEQALIVGARPDGLQALCAEKSAVLEQLVEAHRRRAEAFTKAGWPRNPNQVERLLGRDREALDAWRRLRGSARACEAVNRLNGELVGQRLQFVTARLDVLRGASRRPGVYNAQGLAGHAPSSSRVIAAA